MDETIKKERRRIEEILRHLLILLENQQNEDKIKAFLQNVKSAILAEFNKI